MRFQVVPTEQVIVLKHASIGSSWVLGPLENECLPVNHCIRAIYAYTTGSPDITIGSTLGDSDIVPLTAIESGWNELNFIDRQSASRKLSITSTTADEVIFNIFYIGLYK